MTLKSHHYLYLFACHLFDFLISNNIIFRFDEKMRNVLIEFERIVVPDDEAIPENSAQYSTESTDNTFTSPQPTSNTAAATILLRKEDEIDDFDFLGDDDNVMRYLNSEKKDPEIPELSCTTPPQDDVLCSKNKKGVGNVRRNPVRKAKEGISYTICDDDDTDDYCKCCVSSFIRLLEV